jgi:FtsP/CotA-like multicopper oxidase with cupredoxin domain
MMMMGPTDLSGPAHLADVAVSGSPSRASVDLPTPSVTDLRGANHDARREIAFTMGMGGMTFGFDGRAFSAERTDQRLSAGAVEEWTIRNPTAFDHPFHLHVWPMQVIDDDGRRPEAPEWRDVVNVPSGGAVTVRFLVDIAGRTVYHCHILDHEDAGMMAVVEARP